MQITREETYRLIWNQLQNSKFKEFYINLLLAKFQKRDRLINIFLVIVTSASISAWAIWQLDYLKWLWAGLVAISQVVLLIKPYLNYTRYTKELNEKYIIIQTINLQYERLWSNFKFERITIEQAHDKALDLKEDLTKGLNFSEDIIISEKKNLAEKAKKKLLIYLKTNYNLKS